MKEDSDILAAYRSGLSINAIRSELKVHYRRIKRVLQQNHVSMRGKDWTNTDNRARIAAKVAKCGYKLLRYSSRRRGKCRFECPEGHVYESNWANFKSGCRCPICALPVRRLTRQIKHPQCQISKGHKEISDWLTSIKVDHKNNSWVLKTCELDIFIPKHNLAIEYCGLYWHTEDSPYKRSRMAHHSKMVLAKNSGIHLVTIFEDEWMNRQSQVKGFLLSLLGLNQKIYGRHTKLVDNLSKKKVRQFLLDNHIFGDCNFKLAFGLLHNEDLVGVCTFGQHHRKKGWALNRLCFKSGLSVVGGTSKLLSLVDFSFVTWADLRWSSGLVYTKIGMIKEAVLPPDYSYVDFSRVGRRLSKQSQKKSNTGCPNNMTEVEWARENNLHRIWDCGKIRYGTK